MGDNNLNKGLLRNFVLGIALMMAIVLLSTGMSGSAEAAPSIPITITSDADLETQATANGWSGDGTEGNPYIIGGLEIDATGSSYAISINFVSKHLVITECHPGELQSCRH